METIFISICSYRDKICKNTLKNLFENAEYPERIYIGICQQNKNKEEECIQNDLYKNQIRILYMDYKEAKGPTYARYLCSLLYKKEDYFLQIDSHTLFIKNWDTECIKMLKHIEKSNKLSKIIISYYPDIYEKHQDYPSNKNITYITKCILNENGIPMFKGAEIKPVKKEPSKNYYIGANFLFTRGIFLTDVPFDPFLPYLFMGEEILLSIRAYTTGYDIYTPNKNLVYHLYTRNKEPKYWNDIRINQNDAHNKVKIILGLENNRMKIKSELIRSSIDIYGLGNIRTLEEYYKESGLYKEIESSLIIENFCIDKERNMNNIYIALIVLSVILVIMIITRILIMK